MHPEQQKVPCDKGKHVRDPDDETYCQVCGWAVCFGCEGAFDLMCDVCDDPYEFDEPTSA